MASDYFGVSYTVAPFVWGYIECSGLGTLIGTGPLDLVPGGASVLTFRPENEFKKGLFIEIRFYKAHSIHDHRVCIVNLHFMHLYLCDAMTLGNIC